MGAKAGPNRHIRGFCWIHACFTSTSRDIRAMRAWQKSTSMSYSTYRSTRTLKDPKVPAPTAEGEPRSAELERDRTGQNIVRLYKIVHSKDPATRVLNEVTGAGARRAQTL